MLQTAATANGSAKMSQLAATMRPQATAQATTIAQPTSQQQHIAEPLHIQQLEAALNMRPFMEHARKVLSQPLSSSDDSNATEEDESQGDGVADNFDDEADGARKKRNRRIGTKDGIVARNSNEDCTETIMNIYFRAPKCQNAFIQLQ